MKVNELRELTLTIAVLLSEPALLRTVRIYITTL